MSAPKQSRSIVTRIDAPALCKLFNEGGYLEAVEQGTLRLIVKKTRVTLMTEIRNWVPGTESQEIHFVDSDNQLVVKAHRFLRPDGRLAASG